MTSRPRTSAAASARRAAYSARGCGAATLGDRVPRLPNRIERSARWNSIYGLRVAGVGGQRRQEDRRFCGPWWSRSSRLSAVRWGHGCKLGVYAQHVYTTLPERDTVLEYLQQQGKGRKIQEILEVAGSCSLFLRLARREADLGSPRRRAARLCLAGLLLSDYNILVLDEPGNHLDVDTVEATAWMQLRGVRGHGGIHEPRMALHWGRAATSVRGVSAHRRVEAPATAARTTTTCTE